MNASQLLSGALLQLLSSQVGRMAGILALSLFLWPSPALAQEAVTVSVPDTSATPGDTVEVPVQVGNLDQADDVTSYQMDFAFSDPAVASYAGYEEENTLSDAAGFSVNDNPDIPRIGAYGTSPINDEADSGVLIRVLFEVESESSTTITLEALDFGEVPADPTEPSFTLSGDPSAANAPPEVDVSPSDVTLKIPGPDLEWTGFGASVFTDPDGDDLSLSASSGDPAVVRIVSSEDPLVLGPEATGEAQITVTATDPSDSSATATFQAVVEERPEGEDEPAEQSSAVIAASNSGDAEASFGATGVGASVQSVQESGTITVGFVPDSSASGDPDFSESFENVSGYRWDIDNEGVNFGSADVTFSLEDADVVGIEDPSSVTILVADNPDGTFETVDTDYDSDRKVLVANGLTSFSTFRLASNNSDNPLPVEMAAFSASATESGVLLEWRTASETDNAGFEVQHQGPGAPAFDGVGFVEGAGTTTAPQSYQYRLSDLEPGTHRFRLQQRDTDGTTSLTDPVVVSIEAERALTLRADGPNPVRQETQLAFTVKQSGHAEVGLYNVLGQQVRQLHSRTATPGERYAVDVGTTGLPTGKYFARLTGPSGTRTQQIVVVR